MTEIQGRRWFPGNGDLRISWIQHDLSKKDGVLTYPPPLFPSPDSYGVSSNFHKESSHSPSLSGTKISPAVLFIIVVLAILFFISGLLHLVVRFLTKNPSSSSRNLEESTSEVLQRQLQQLFHLHDTGLDQAFINVLPVFSYGEIVGAQEPFDCAICLCEFCGTDQLRLLPTCSHAFHINCIDTWLLANSTCPICRGSLCNPGFSIENPVFEYDDFRGEDGCSSYRDNELSIIQRSSEIEEVATIKGGFPVRLGKFRKVNGVIEDVGETSSSKLDARRCYSMGSYQYVVGKTNIRVSFCHNQGGGDSNRASVRDQDSNSYDEGSTKGKNICIGTRTDSYSVSKIWLWSKKDKYVSSSDANADLDNPSSTRLDLLPWMHRTTDAI